MRTRLVTLLASLLSSVLLAVMLLSELAVPVQASPGVVRHVALGGTCGGMPNCYATVKPPSTRRLLVTRFASPPALLRIPMRAPGMTFRQRAT